MPPFPSAFRPLLFALCLWPGLAAGAGEEASLTQAVKDVRFVVANGSNRVLHSGDTLAAGTRISTGEKSRAEIVFTDRELFRLGANTLFNLGDASHPFELLQGTLLVHVPRGARGRKIRTAAVTAAPAGTTILLEHTPARTVVEQGKKKLLKAYIKVIVLAGDLRLFVNSRRGESVLLEPGQMVITSPDGGLLPGAVDVDLKRLAESSVLVNSKHWNGSDARVSLALMQPEFQKQAKEKTQGVLIETNLAIFGRGTNVVIKPAEIPSAPGAPAGAKRATPPATPDTP